MTAPNPRQAKFVREYLSNGGNATLAYKKAGYSKNGADRSAHALLRNPEIAALVAVKRAEMEAIWRDVLNRPFP